MSEADHDTNEVREKILCRVRKNGDCWEWVGKKNDKGYGLLKVGLRTHRAHRLSYAEFVGPIPAGRLVCHSCNNPTCINPDHLYAGTHQQNMLDMVRCGRHGSSVPGCRDGEKNPRAKLTNEDAAVIRRKIAEGCGKRALAREYKVSIGVIINIDQNRAYRIPSSDGSNV